jgi:hypothetical protein
MRRLLLVLFASLVASPAVHAATITFDTNPLIGDPALTTPGRQIVGGEPSLTFDIATDVLVFDSAQFGITHPLSFFNGLVADMPESGTDVVVVQDTGTPFLAGLAANLIAARVTTSGPGFFIYFNTNLGLPRLVYSTDLDDPTADLAVLARFTNLTGPEGFAALPTITEDNFAVPEPATLALLAAATLGAMRRRVRSRTR